MLFSLFQRKSEKNRAARQLYDSIVSQARQKTFYSEYKVPDTVEGRFEMIALHTFLFIQRLKQEGLKDHEMGKLVLETFFSDIDGSLREMGVGDLTVPKKMRKISDSFYGSAYAYSDALEADDLEMMKTALERNIFSHYGEETGTPSPYTAENVTDLAKYVIDSYPVICSNSLEELFQGHIRFSNVS